MVIRAPPDDKHTRGLGSLVGTANRSCIKFKSCRFAARWSWIKLVRNRAATRAAGLPAQKDKAATLFSAMNLLALPGKPTIKLTRAAGTQTLRTSRSFEGQDCTLKISHASTFFSRRSPAPRTFSHEKGSAGASSLVSHSFFLLLAPWGIHTFCIKKSPAPRTFSHEKGSAGASLLVSHTLSFLLLATHNFCTKKSPAPRTFSHEKGPAGEKTFIFW